MSFWGILYFLGYAYVTVKVCSHQHTNTPTHKQDFRSAWMRQDFRSAWMHQVSRRRRLFVLRSSPGGARVELGRVLPPVRRRDVPKSAPRAALGAGAQARARARAALRHPSRGPRHAVLAGHQGRAQSTARRTFSERSPENIACHRCMSHTQLRHGHGDLTVA